MADIIHKTSGKVNNNQFSAEDSIMKASSYTINTSKLTVNADSVDFSKASRVMSQGSGTYSSSKQYKKEVTSEEAIRNSVRSSYVKKDRKDEINWLKKYLKLEKSIRSKNQKSLDKEYSKLTTSRNRIGGVELSNKSTNTSKAATAAVSYMMNLISSQVSSALTSATTTYGSYRSGGTSELRITKSASSKLQKLVQSQAYDIFGAIGNDVVNTAYSAVLQSGFRSKDINKISDRTLATLLATETASMSANTELFDYLMTSYDNSTKWIKSIAGMQSTLEKAGYSDQSPVIDSFINSNASFIKRYAKTESDMISLSKGLYSTASAARASGMNSSDLLSFVKEFSDITPSSITGLQGISLASMGGLEGAQNLLSSGQFDKAAQMIMKTFSNLEFQNMADYQLNQISNELGVDSDFFRQLVRFGDSVSSNIDNIDSLNLSYEDNIKAADDYTRLIKDNALLTEEITTSLENSLTGLAKLDAELGGLVTTGISSLFSVATSRISSIGAGLSRYGSSLITSGSLAGSLTGVAGGAVAVGAGIADVVQSGKLVGTQKGDQETKGLAKIIAGIGVGAAAGAVGGPIGAAIGAVGGILATTVIGPLVDLTNGTTGTKKSIEAVTRANDSYKSSLDSITALTNYSNDSSESNLESLRSLYPSVLTAKSDELQLLDKQLSDIKAINDAKKEQAEFDKNYAYSTFMDQSSAVNKRITAYGSADSSRLSTSDYNSLYETAYGEGGTWADRMSLRYELAKARGSSTIGAGIGAFFSGIGSGTKAQEKASMSNYAEALSASSTQNISDMMSAVSIFSLLVDDPVKFKSAYETLTSSSKSAMSGHWSDLLGSDNLSYINSQLGYNLHKSGLPSVPYDDYKASLHKGELVLNASQAAYVKTHSDMMKDNGTDYSDYYYSLASLGGYKLGYVPYDNYLTRLSKGDMILNKRMADKFRALNYISRMDNLLSSSIEDEPHNNTVSADVLASEPSELASSPDQTPSLGSFQSSSLVDDHGNSLVGGKLYYKKASAPTLRRVHDWFEKRLMAMSASYKKTLQISWGLRSAAEQDAISSYNSMHELGLAADVQGWARNVAKGSEESLNLTRRAKDSSGNWEYWHYTPLEIYNGDKAISWDKLKKKYGIPSLATIKDGTYITPDTYGATSTKMASGGIVTEELSNVTIGEKARKEAVIPLESARTDEIFNKITGGSESTAKVVDVVKWLDSRVESKINQVIEAIYDNGPSVTSSSGISQEAKDRITRSNFMEGRVG